MGGIRPDFPDDPIPSAPNGAVILPDIEVGPDPYRHPLYMADLTPEQRRMVQRLHQYRLNYAGENFPRAVASGVFGNALSLGTIPADVLGALASGMRPDSKQSIWEPLKSLFGQGPLTQQMFSGVDALTGNDPEAPLAGVGNVAGAAMDPGLLMAGIRAPGALARGLERIASRIEGVTPAQEAMTMRGREILRNMAAAGTPQLPEGVKFMHSGFSREPDKVPALHRLIQESPAGGTLLPSTLKPHSGSGYLVSDPKFVAYLKPGEDATALQAWLESPGVGARLRKPGARIGWWFDEQNNQFEINVSDYVKNRRKAVNLGRARKEFGVGIFKGNEYTGTLELLTPDEAQKYGYNDPTKLPPMNQLGADEKQSVGWTLALRTVGTKNQDEWLNAIEAFEKQNNPGGTTPLANRLRQSPRVRDDLYRSAQRQQKSVEAMYRRITPDQAVADAHAVRDGNEASTKWYQGWWAPVKKALGEDLARRFTQASGVLSVRSSPAEETYRALLALKAHVEGKSIPEALTKLPAKAGAGGYGFKPATRKMAQKVVAAFEGQPVHGMSPEDIARGKIADPKTSSYILNRMGFTDIATIDAHMLKYYTGKSNASPAMKIAVAQRVAEDAQKAGMTTADFQAAIWAKQTGYKSGFGEAGAAPEDWLQYWLAQPDFEKLTWRHAWDRFAKDGIGEILAVEEIPHQLGMLRSQGFEKSIKKWHSEELVPKRPWMPPKASAPPPHTRGQTGFELAGPEGLYEHSPFSNVSVPSDQYFEGLPTRSLSEHLRLMTAQGMPKAARALARFMKDSKITHPVFHASERSFFEFKHGDIGFHFGNPEQAAARMARVREPTLAPSRGTVYPVWISLKKPLFVPDDPGTWEGWDLTGVIDEALTEAGERPLPPHVRNLENEGTQKYQGAVRKELRRRGYDGLEYPNKYEGGEGAMSWVVFSPEQIKSAIGNRGTYSPKQKNIVRSVGGLLAGGAAAEAD